MRLRRLFFKIVVNALPLIGPGCALWPRHNPPAATEAANPTAQVSVLVTRNFEVTITVNCPVDEVECNDVTYHAVSKRSGESVTLKGSTFHTHSADGFPSRFLGYRFNSGNVEYQVLEDGRLRITRGDSDVLVDEEGVWHDLD
ncbi:MAG TPA: hypothetical protein VIL86_09135 [Tepidisphaeraceae bacterium]|jgi:hypothetical protein